MNSNNQRQFDELVAGLCDGCLGEAEIVRLDELLQCDPALRARYIKHMAVHAGLAWDLAAEPSSAAPGAPARARPRRFWQRKATLAAAFAAWAAGASAQGRSGPVEDRIRKK